MGQVAAEDRREQARAVVLRLLGEGRRFENVSLRDVARELEVPVSTLTYAYSSITDLLDDFATSVDERMLLHRVGSGGLRGELSGYVDEVVTMLMADPGLREVWRYRLGRVGQGWLVTEAERWSEVIAMIRAAAEERYRLDDRTLGQAFWSLVLGEVTCWLDEPGSDPGLLHNRLTAAVRLLVLAADPQPALA